MSGMGEDDRDLLAGEYVLGVLDGAERDAVRTEAERDRGLEDAIIAWENQLAPLGALVPAVPAPAGLWPRIAATCGFTPAAQPRPLRTPLLARVNLWRTTTAIGFGLAAALAAFVLLRPAAPPPAAPPVPLASAVLAPPKGGAPVWLAAAGPDGALRFAPLQPITVAQGRDLELWGLPDGGTVPKPLGLITPQGRSITLPAGLRAPMEIMVSLEQKGGSPSGLPQGPVLWQGHLPALAVPG